MNILITGGNGYFGRHMAQHLLGIPETNKVAIFSRGEASQAAMAESMGSDKLRFWIGDVRDRDRLERAFNGIDTVIHAAALKRVEVGEYNPTEMVQTNVLGTMNVIRAAQKQKVKSLIVLSTDKACAPLNAYGATKLVAEKLALAAGAENPGGPRVVVTRYGNVAGSTGSIIPTWRKAIAEGKTLACTDPEATRFWMTAHQACDLVCRAIGYSRGVDRGGMIVPSLRAYKVYDLLMAMAIGSRWEITGLRPGEKRHEEMISEHEASGFSRVDDYWFKVADLPMAPVNALRRRTALRSNDVDRITGEELRKAVEAIK